MSVQNFINYEAYIELQNKQLEIWGQPCTIYSPTRREALGYENTNPSEIEKMDSDEVLGNTYTKKESRIWINFTVQKSVYYRKNWFPEEGEELCQAFLTSDSPVREGDYIRTATPQATSIYGDTLFIVRKIFDEGLTQVLQRSYLLKPCANEDLHFELDF